MLQISDRFELPEYVPEAEYFPFGLTTASVPADRLDDLEKHDGVIALWLQTEERPRRGPIHKSARVEMSIPAELVNRFGALFSTLVDKGVSRLDVFRYARPGEPAYWRAFLLTQAGRYTAGTPDLRYLPMEPQAEDLARQLEHWTPGPGQTLNFSEVLTESEKFHLR